MSSLNQDTHGASSKTSTTSNDQNRAETWQRRRPVPRKGHTKSRRGCFNCKRRRIKCNEKHPKCNRCIKAGLQCEYNLSSVNLVQQFSAPCLQKVLNLQSTPSIFSMSDMRLFRHFLTTAYPQLPIDADSIWVTVPSFANNVRGPLAREGYGYEYDYLIHSILALSASHLGTVTSSSTAELAIQHRILAVKLLNEALSIPPRTQSEREARMAAALALAFQSSHIDCLAGLSEFLTMIRGVSLIAGMGASVVTDSIFSGYQYDQIRTTKSRRATSQHLNRINPEDLNLATLSLHRLDTLSIKSWERMYWETLVCTVRYAYDQPVEAYTAFTALYTIPSQWTHDEFESFIDPNNSIAQILLAHFIALQATLTPILYIERVGAQVHPPAAMMGWIDCIHTVLPPHLRAHVEWPRQVSAYTLSKSGAG